MENNPYYGIPSVITRLLRKAFEVDQEAGKLFEGGRKSAAHARLSQGGHHEAAFLVDLYLPNKG